MIRLFFLSSLTLTVREAPAEPSPPGRGQGFAPSLDGAGKVAARNPHPGPLPEGEGEISWVGRRYVAPAMPCQTAIA
jgi:hypothetical protein